MRVLVDGRVAGADGIGRYTRCVTATLADLPVPPDVQVLQPTGTSSYTRAAGTELITEGRRRGVDLIHALDYRIPVREADHLPLIVTVHDVLRLVRPSLCYSDDTFRRRLGAAGFEELRAAVDDLREVAPFPTPGAPASLHEEFLGRMLSHASVQASGVVTPTAAVARDLCGIVPHVARKIVVSAFGVDHLPPPSNSAIPSVPRPYLLYVGQARPHKGLPVLLAAVASSGTYRDGAHLGLVGRDFAAGSVAVAAASAAVGDQRVHAFGEVPDSTLSTLYAHAMALIHPATHEGFGFPPLEALAHGCPVVAADIPALRETLGELAAFADPHDPGDIAKHLDDLTSHATTANRSDRTRWASRFTWRGHAADLLTCYRRVLHA